MAFQLGPCSKIVLPAWQPALHVPVEQQLHCFAWQHLEVTQTCAMSR